MSNNENWTTGGYPTSDSEAIIYECPEHRERITLHHSRPGEPLPVIFHECGERMKVVD